MKVTTVEIFNTDDVNCTSDHIQRYMFVNDQLLFQGSNLKNSIDQMIAGALALLFFRQKTFTHERISVNNTPLYYEFMDNDIEPSDWLAQVRERDDITTTITTN